MRKKLAALYNPYLDTFGGGEKHTLSIMKVLEDMGYEIHIFWDKNLSDDIQKKLHIMFQSASFIPSPFSSSLLHKLRILSHYDILVWVTDGSYPFSSARHNYAFCMVPDKKLFEMNIINKIKTHRWKFICNSHYTQQILSHINIHADVIYPTIDEKYLQPYIPFKQKEHIILSVGRFFTHLHSKKQDKTIELFQLLKKNSSLFSDFQLVLAGGMKEENSDYVTYLRTLISDSDNIRIATNISNEELYTLYKQAGWYWHMAGYDSDTLNHPEQAEHLGITPLEAMANGCIPFCYKAGGPIEYIKDRENGFLFQTQQELIESMIFSIQNESKMQLIQQKAADTVKNTFSEIQLQKRVQEIFPIL